MAKRSSASVIGWAILGCLVLIVMVPLHVWIMLGALAALIAIIYVFIKVASGATTSQPPKGATGSTWSADREPTMAELLAKSEPGRRPEKVASRTTALPPARTQLGQAGSGPLRGQQPPVQVASGSASARSAHEQVPEAVARSSGSGGFFAATFGGHPAQPKGHALPKAPDGYSVARWVQPNETIQVAGLSLPGGLFYVGARMSSTSGRTDPALINPGLPVARRGDFTQRQMDYWPSYSEISPSARRAYLEWLAGGRSDPRCDIGFVFLFFYGLERRVILADKEDSSARAGWPVIEDEIRRLLSIYGGGSPSFRRYAGELLNWMAIDLPAGRLYETPVPDLPQGRELPLYLRLALGQAAVDRAPVPAPLALAWARHDPGISIHTAGKRCPEEFGRLFVQHYADEFGAGMVLPKNRTKLKFIYRPASAGLMGEGSLARTFGDVPDVTVLTAPPQKLQQVVDRSADELARFSRVIGKDPEARNRLDGLLHLPGSLWPRSARAKLQGLLDWMEDGRLTLPLGDLLSALGGNGDSLSRERARGLAQALQALNIGIEPDVLSGARVPAIDESIVLFTIEPGEKPEADSAAYQAATLTLQLASAVAVADGEFSEQELEHLRAEVRGWTHLTPAHQRRLQAHVQWLTSSPVSLASLKKRLEPLDQRARETIAAFMATLAQADGFVSPKEVKLLEKAYRALGVDAKRVFSDVHAVAAGAPGAQKQGAKGFQLDPERIAELQRDTKRVTALLADIFKEEEATAEEAVDAPDELPESVRLLGLDETHTALVRLLMSRPQWMRGELEDAAADLELMLDGALERINEASFDAYDMALFEGDDPVEVNVLVVEKLEE